MAEHILQHFSYQMIICIWNLLLCPFSNRMYICLFAFTEIVPSQVEASHVSSPLVQVWSAELIAYVCWNQFLARSIWFTFFSCWMQLSSSFAPEPPLSPLTTFRMLITCSVQQHTCYSFKTSLFHPLKEGNGDFLSTIWPFLLSPRRRRSRRTISFDF